MFRMKRIFGVCLKGGSSQKASVQEVCIQLEMVPDSLACGGLVRCLF